MSWSEREQRHESCNRIIYKSNDDLMQNKGQKIIIITKKAKKKGFQAHSIQQMYFGFLKALDSVFLFAVLFFFLRFASFCNKRKGIRITSLLCVVRGIRESWHREMSCVFTFPFGILTFSSFESKSIRRVIHLMLFRVDSSVSLSVCRIPFHPFHRRSIRFQVLAFGYLGECKR